MGRTALEDPEDYFRNSPIFLAPQIDVPVMIGAANSGPRWRDMAKQMLHACDEGTA